MTRGEIATAAFRAMLSGGRVTFTLSPMEKWPKGWPRGELLSVTDQGKNYSFDPVKVLAWVARYCRFSAKCDVYVYDDVHGSVTTHVKNGDVYFRQSPNLAADRLESLRADGYAIPQDAIDSLRERAAG